MRDDGKMAAAEAATERGFEARGGVRSSGPRTTPPTVTAASPGESFLELIAAQLRGICTAAGFEESDVAAAASLLEEALGPWGSAAIGVVPRAASDIGDDHFPVEFSVALRDDACEIRVLFEVQSEDVSVAGQWVGAQALGERLGRHHGVSLERFLQVRDLFVPTDPRARYGIWHSICWRAGHAPKFKIYINPQAQGRTRAPAVVGEALRRLGFSGAARDLVASSRSDVELKFFSLDLDSSADARVKVYKVHPGASRPDIEAELGKARCYQPEPLADFWRAIAVDNGPFHDLPISTYLALTSGQDLPIGATVHFPVRAYVDDDQVVHDRLWRFLPDPARRNYARILRAFARRPLADGVGMHSYVALGFAGGAPRVTIYLAPEIYHVVPPRSARVHGGAGAR